MQWLIISVGLRPLLLDKYAFIGLFCSIAAAKLGLSIIIHNLMSLSLCVRSGIGSLTARITKVIELKEACKKYTNATAERHNVFLECKTH